MKLSNIEGAGDHGIDPEHAAAIRGAIRYATLYYLQFNNPELPINRLPDLVDEVSLDIYNSKNGRIKKKKLPEPSAEELKNFSGHAALLREFGRFNHPSSDLISGHIIKIGQTKYFYCIDKARFREFEKIRLERKGYTLVDDNDLTE